jgi:hypothetical protein
MARGVKSYTLRSGRMSCRSAEDPIEVTLWRKEPGAMGARYSISIDGADDGMGADGARKIAARLIRFADYIDRRRGRTPPPIREEPAVSWWYLLDTEAGRDQTMAHAVPRNTRTTYCRLPLDERLSEQAYDEAEMEDEEFCPECVAKGAPKPEPPDDD